MIENILPRNDISKNGEVNSCKRWFLYKKKIEKWSRKDQNQLWEKSGEESKADSNQINAESR